MLFKNENPVLGPTSQITEVGLTSTSSTALATNSFKPTSREVVTVPLVAGALAQWAYKAPWACQVLAIRFNGTVVGAASNLSVEKINTDGVAPAAANAGTIVLLTNAVFALNTFTPNTWANIALSTASGALNLNPGDGIALFVSASDAGLVGAVVQIELAQIG